MPIPVFLLQYKDYNCLFRFRSYIKRFLLLKKIAEEFKLPLPEWIIIQQPVNLQVQMVLSLILDAGEASAIALAYDYVNAILIINDLKARKEAIRLGFKITGTLGVLYRLKKDGLIHSLKNEINRLTEIGFRISSKIIDEILKNAGEKTI